MCSLTRSWRALVWTLKLADAITTSKVEEIFYLINFCQINVIIKSINIVIVGSATIVRSFNFDATCPWVTSTPRVACHDNYGPAKIGPPSYSRNTEGAILQLDLIRNVFLHPSLRFWSLHKRVSGFRLSCRMTAVILYIVIHVIRNLYL